MALTLYDLDGLLKLINSYNIVRNQSSFPFSMYQNWKWHTVLGYERSCIPMPIIDGVIVYKIQNFIIPHTIQITQLLLCNKVGKIESQINSESLYFMKISIYANMRKIFAFKQ